jgi:hypothetical protein
MNAHRWTSLSNARGDRHREPRRRPRGVRCPELLEALA